MVLPATCHILLKAPKSPKILLRWFGVTNHLAGQVVKIQKVLEKHPVYFFLLRPQKAKKQYPWLTVSDPHL